MEKQEIREKLQLVVEKLMHLDSRKKEERLETEDDRLAAFNRRDSGIAIWDWPQGVGLYGLLKLMEAEESGKYKAFLYSWYEGHLKKGLPLKNINTSAPLLPLAELIDEAHPEFEKLALEWADWLVKELPKTSEGGFQHVTSGNEEGTALLLNEEQLWVDTLFMAVLFLNRMGQKYQREDWRNEAEYQMLLHIRYLCDPESGLLYHGWTFRERNHFGGVKWCRGDSWFTVVVPEYLEDCGEKITPAVRRIVENAFRAQVETLKKLQAEDGLWHTVLTNPASYKEVSGSAGIAAGILKGIRTGLLGEEYRAVAEAAVAGILRNISEDGTVLNVSAGTGMGMDEAHYEGIMLAPMAYGQSLCILALSEALRAGA